MPGHPFAVAITLAGFTAESTDAEWKPTLIHNAQGGIRKLAKLDAFAIYFDTDSPSLAGLPKDEALTKFMDLVATKDKTPDHQFILKPVSGEARVILRNSYSEQTPKLDVELFFNELGFVLDEDQYRDALSMVDLFHFYTRKNQYRRMRPPEEAFTENRPKALFKFAIDAILTEVHERHHRWSWDYFRQRRDDRKEYVELYKLKEKKMASAKDQARLTDLEWGLTYKDIRFYRSIASSALRKERKGQEIAKSGQAQTGWMGWIWGSSKAADSSADGGSTEGLTEEQRKELYDAIDFDERAAISASVDLPREIEKIRLKAKLETGVVCLEASASWQECRRGVGPVRFVSSRCRSTAG